MTHDLSKSSRMSGLLACAAAAGIACSILFSAPAMASPANDNDAAVVQADHSLSAAIAKADKTAVGGLLDAGFEWPDGEGNTRNKAETLQNLPALATASQGDTDVKTLPYSQLAIVYGTHHNDRLVRIWVKRPEGWRAFVDMDTPIPPEGRGGGGRGGAGGAGGTEAH